MDVTLRKRIAAYVDTFCPPDANPEDRRRIGLLVALSAVGILFLLLFSITARLQGNWALCLFDLATAMVLALNLVDTRRRQKFPFNIRVGIAFVSLLFVYLYVSGGINGTASVWYFTYPLIACYLLGAKSGALVSGLMLLPVLALLLSDFRHPLVAHYSLTFVWRFAAAYLVITAFSFLFEQTREKNREELRAINQSLENLVRERTAALTTANVQLTAEVEKRRQAHQSMRLSQEILMTVMDSIDANIFVADMETHEILFMNRHMQEAFGRDLTGAQCWQALRGEPGPCSYCTNPRLIDDRRQSTGLHVWQGEQPVTGQWYIHYERAIPWIDGRLVRIQIAVDITEHKRTEEKLRQAQKMETIGTLAGGIAHDFNNLLGIIIGNMELALVDIPQSNPAHVNLEEIKTAGFRAQEIVKQLLRFSRKTNEAFQPMALAPVIEDAAKFLRAAIPSTVQIELALSDREITIQAEATQIHQIMMNLCTNASQAMQPNGGGIRIDLARMALGEDDVPNFPGLSAGDYVQWRIADNGPGIEPDVREHVFVPYFTTKAVGNGSGMGLAVVHGIVEKHHGSITVASSPGQGTTFTILLPLVDAAPAPDAPHQRDMPTGSERILLVDDEEALLAMGQKVLGRMGYTVEAFVSAEDALAAFGNDPQLYDLVITDLTMPQMTGVALCAQIKALREDIPVIICSGHGDIVDPENAADQGFAAFLMKPILMQDLACTIRAVCDESPAVAPADGAATP